MSAASSSNASVSSMASEQRAYEPSMEEILASIRRIIADDQMLPLTRTGPVAPPIPAPSHEAIVVNAAPAPIPTVEPRERVREPMQILRPESARPAAPESVVAGTPAPVDEAPAESAAEIVAAPAHATPVRPAQEGFVRPLRETLARPASAHVRPAAKTTSEEGLLSPSTGASVSHAFGALATTMFMQNTAMVEEALRESLRPLLKQWLDDNLPVMVERLVRGEIERVARGARG